MESRRALAVALRGIECARRHRLVELVDRSAQTRRVDANPEARSSTVLAVTGLERW
jgi:hypothetical protein